VEADLLVNLDESHSEETPARSMQDKIIKTPTGLRYLDVLFLMPARNIDKPTRSGIMYMEKMSPIM
jgi:hypothetical protein